MIKRAKQLEVGTTTTRHTFTDCTYEMVQECNTRRFDWLRVTLRSTGEICRFPARNIVMFRSVEEETKCGCTNDKKTPDRCCPYCNGRGWVSDF